VTATEQSVHVPEVDEDGAEWWEGLERDEIQFSRCMSCGQTSFPPIPGCPHCGSTELASERSAGGGSVYSWVVIHVALDPSFASEVPYTVVAVDLDEGARIVGRLRDESQRSVLRGGARAAAEVYRIDGQALLGYRLVEGR
jgi:uncharacterized OB-fold protein